MLRPGNKQEQPSITFSSQMPDFIVPNDAQRIHSMSVIFVSHVSRKLQ